MCLRNTGEHGDVLILNRGGDQPGGHHIFRMSQGNWEKGEDPQRVVVVGFE